MLLSGVTSNLTGMLVYNTSTTGGAGVNTIGIYYWNGATWVKASLPSTSASDSGKILISNGTGWVASQAILAVDTNSFVLSTRSFGGVTWTKVLDTVIHFGIRPNHFKRIPTSGIRWYDHCKSYAGNLMVAAVTDTLLIWNAFMGYGGASTIDWGIRCYRPSM